MAVSIGDLQVLIEASVKAALAGQKSAAAGRPSNGQVGWEELEGVFFPVQDSGGLSEIFADVSDQDIERGAAEAFRMARVGRLGANSSTGSIPGHQQSR